MISEWEWENLPRVKLKEFFPELRFEFQDLPPQLYTYYLWQTAVDMAEKGNLLRYWEEVPLKKDVTRYFLTPPENTVIWNVMGIFHSPRAGIPGIDEIPGGSDEITDVLPQGAFFCHKNIAWYEPYTKSLHYNDAANAAGQSLYVNVSLTLGDEGCELPAVYKERFHEMLILGTRARIKLIPGKEWSNIELGTKLMEQYRVLLTTEAKWVAQRRQRWWLLAMTPDLETLRCFLNTSEYCLDEDVTPVNAEIESYSLQSADWGMSQRRYKPRTIRKRRKK